MPRVNGVVRLVINYVTGVSKASELIGIFCTGEVHA